MARELTIGIIGDLDLGRPSHGATNEALQHAGEYLGVRTSVIWLPTRSLETQAGRQKLDLFDALWASPGSPYESADGALRGIQYARVTDRPFLGT